MTLRPFDAGLLATHIVLSVGGLLLIKANAPHVRLAWQHQEALWPAIGLLSLGAACYISSFLVWMILLSRSELSVIYPITVGATVTLSTIAAATLLGEGVSMLRLLGIVCIVFGVVMIVRH